MAAHRDQKHSGSASHSFNKRHLLYLALLCFTILAIPIFMVQIPPMCDYPNHLARILILNHPTNTYYHRFFTVTLRPIPNLAFDAVTFVLSHVMSVYTAGRIFLVLTLISFVSGAYFLHGAIFGRSPWPLVAALFAYNGVFLVGEINYIFGVGCAFLFSALWLRMRTKQPTTRLLIGTILSLCMYFIHALAFGVYAIIISVFEIYFFLSDREQILPRRITNLIVGAIPFLPPLAVFFYTTDAQNSKFSLLSTIHSQSIVSYALSRVDLFKDVGAGYDTTIDAAIFIFIIICIVYSFATGMVRVSGPLMIISGLLLAIIFFMSNGTVFHTVGLPGRFPIVFLLLIISGVDVGLNRRAAPLFYFAAVVLFLIQTGTVAAKFHAYRSDVTDFRQALSMIPPGSKIFMTKADALPGKIFRSAPIRQLHACFGHLQVLVIAEHHAFAPNFFANPEKQILRVNKKYRRLAYVDGGRPTPWSWAMGVRDKPHAPHPFLKAPIWEPTRNWWLRYDYLTLTYPQFVPNLPKRSDTELKLLSSSHWINVYKILDPAEQRLTSSGKAETAR